MKTFLSLLPSLVGILTATIVSADVESDSPYRFPFFTGKILPTPQQVEYHELAVPLDKTSVLLGPGIAPDDGRLRELRGRVTAHGGELEIVGSLDSAERTVIILGSHPDAASLLHGKAAPHMPEGYLIEPVKHEGRTIICLKGHDDQGLLWAVVSLNQLITGQEGRAVLHLASVSDYPATAGRAFLGTLSDRAARQAVAFKFNRLKFGEPEGYRPRSLPERWRTPYPEESKAVIREAGEYLNPLGIEWYGGGRRVGSRPEHQIRSKSEEDFRIIFEQVCAWLDAGAHAGIKYDDARFPISEEDLRDFGTAREADIYFLNKLYDAMQERRPGSKLLVCPPFYWGPSSPSLYPEGRDEYLRAIGERLPKEIGIWWTGPRVKSGRVTPEMTEWITERIQRKPWYWQNACGMTHVHNYHFYTDPVPAWRDWFYPGFFDEMAAFGLNGSSSDYRLPSTTLADYLWNPGAYEPESSIMDAAMKFYGVQSWPLLVELNKHLSYFDQYELKRSPLAVRNIDEIKVKLDKLEATHAALQEIRPEFNSRYVGQIQRWHRRLLSDPMLKERVAAAEVLREHAEADIQLRNGDTFIAASDFRGGKQGYYALRCERRFQLTLFGSESAYPDAAARFEIDPFPPAGDYQLIISGQDNDAESKCRIQITVNDHEIFSGENPFTACGWSWETFTVPVLALDRYNVLTIKNIEPGAHQNAPPWVMINYAVLRKTAD